MISHRTFSVPDGAQSWRVRGAVFQLSPQAVDAVKREGVGFGVCPDAVADVVHDARIGDRHADVVGALAADFPPDDVAGLDGLVGGHHFPIGMVGQVSADVGNPTVVNVGVGGLAFSLAVLVHFLLEIDP